MPRIRAIAESLPASNPVRRAAKVNPRHPATKLYSSPDGGSVRLTWSPVNQAWSLLWPGDVPVERQQVLNVFNRWEEGDEEARRIVERASAENPHLTAAHRHDLPSSAFALPGRRALPIEDAEHIRAAAARLSMMRHEGHVTHAEYVEAHRRIAAAGRKHGIEITEAAENPGKAGQHRYLAKLRGVGRIPLWAESLEKAQRAAGAHAAAYRTTVESVVPDPEDPEPTGNPLSYGSQQYRGYELLTSNVIRGGTTVGAEVDVMKNGSREARVEATNVTLALAKAKRIVDAMHGD